MFEFKKFPSIQFKGAPLVWDSRQDSDPSEWVLVSEDLPLEIQKALFDRAQKNHQSIGPLGSGAKIEVLHPRRYLGEIASQHFLEPSKKLKIFAITGTNGKTTSASLLRQLLVGQGFRTAELGTLGLRVYEPGGDEALIDLDTGYTTPEGPQLHALLAQLLKRGVQCVVMEASSHALVLGRIGGLHIDCALFTNLTQDHLDFHKTMENYEAAKLSLFTDYLASSAKSPKLAIINGISEVGQRIYSRIPVSITKNLITESSFKIVKQDYRGSVFEWKDTCFESPLIGYHNVENLVGALMVASEYFSSVPADFTEIVKNLKGVKGRLERVSAVHGKKHVFVDYAHTPDALQRCLETLLTIKGTAKLWVLFGCGGDRDKGKRPLMGAIAAKLADRVIVSSDNPRTEDPQAIADDILVGIGANERSRVQCVLSRAEAIAAAIRGMETNDLLVVAGKGHEEYQIIGKEKRPFSDQALCRHFLAANV